MKTFRRFLTEGGSFGHLNHPYDLDHLKFSDLGKIINQALSGTLSYAQVKTDAVNLMFSYKNGKVIASRNKSHLKNFGENAMDMSGIASKFKGRDIGIAYTKAMVDLQKGLDQLSDAQKNKIFGEGKRWMSIEVMSPQSRNIINYGDDFYELRLHGTLEVNEKGEIISQVNKEAARTLEGMLKQRNANRQKTYTIKDLTKADLPKIPDITAMRKKYYGDLVKIMRSVGAKSNDTIYSYKEKKVNAILDKLESDYKTEIPIDVKNSIKDRWINGNKSNKIITIVKLLPDPLKKPFKAMDKNVNKIMGEISDPFRELFLKLGADVLLHMTSFMVHNPDKTVQGIKKKIESAAKAIKSSGRPELIDKLNQEMRRFQSAGGMNSIIPEEGVTFFYKDSSGKSNFMKLTGTFAPINQIINLQWRL